MARVCLGLEIEIAKGMDFFLVPKFPPINHKHFTKIHSNNMKGSVAQLVTFADASQN